MDKKLNLLIAFSLGMNCVLLPLSMGISPEGMSLWDMRVLPDLVAECEKALPRNQKCELIAQPIERL